MYECYVLGGGAPKTVAQAIESYLAWRRPKSYDCRYLERLKGWFGRLQLHQVDQGRMDEAALVLLPGAAAETWNRQVYTPMSAVLKHAGVTIAIKRPRQRKPRHKALSRESTEVLIANAKPNLAALLTVLFFTGCRISEAIGLTWDRVDLNGRLLRFDVTKTDEDSWRPMHDRVFEAIANLPREHDHIFRWKTRAGPSKEIADLCAATGIKFHPHMARHTFATRLADAGVNLRDIMDAGGWKDHKSVLRYTAPDVERVRRQIAKL